MTPSPTRPSRRALSNRALKFLFCALFACAHAIAQSPQILPPSQGVAPAIVTADSGIKTVADGHGWSEWYRLGVGKAPNGYTIHNAEFWLTGDRSCGPLAECREVVRNDEQVLWEFRLKENDAANAPRKAVCEAHIRVTYRPRD